MSIDTRAKRFSMLNFGWLPTVALFEADGTVDADDRAHMLNLYAGIALAIPAAIVIVEIISATLDIRQTVLATLHITQLIETTENIIQLVEKDVER